MKKTVWASVLVVGLLACDEEIADLSGEALRDAGQVLSDAGALLSDAGNDAALAEDDAGPAAPPRSETVEVPCDERYERTKATDQTIPLGGQLEHAEYVTANYYATVRTDTSALVGVDAIACDLVPVGVNQPVVACEPLWTCTGSDTPPEAARCRTVTATIGEGFVRVQCGQWRKSTGYHAQVMFGGGEAGERYKTVRITIRR